MKSMIGAGILAIPWALSRFGLVAGLLGMALLAGINVLAIRLLLACRIELHRQDIASSVPAREDDAPVLEASPPAVELNPYETVAERAVGRRFALATTAALITAQLGVVTAYIDVITVTVQVLLPWLPRVLIICGLWLFTAGTGFLRGLSEVSWLAIAGLSCYLTVIASLLYYGGSRIRDGTAGELVLFDVRGFGWWYGIAMYAFEGIGTVLPIFEEMRTLHRPDRFIRVVHVTYGAAFLFYVFVGGVGYAAYGGETLDVIIFNFPDSLLTVVTARSMALMMLFTSVVQVYPVIGIADEWLSHRLGRPATTFNFAERLALRAGVTLVPAAIACVAPQVSTVVDLIGSVCFSFLGVIAPVVMYTRIFRSELSRSALGGLGALAAFGVLGGVFGTISPFISAHRR
jgi:proton-coupled amino acid transporter